MSRKKHMQIIVDNLIRNLKKRHMEGFYFSSKDELMSYLVSLCRQHHIQLGTDSVFQWIEEFPDTDPLQPELF